MAKSVREQIRNIQIRQGPDRAGALSPAAWPRFGSEDVARYGALGLSDDEVAAPGNSHVRRSAPSSIAVAKSSDGARDVVTLERSEPLPLIGHLAHHRVDDDNLWIAVEDGKLIVVDDREHLVVRSLITGASPVDAALGLARTSGMAEPDAWAITLKLVARLAAAGMIEGVRGYHWSRRYVRNPSLGFI